jgi:hypothetical protein
MHMRFLHAGQIRPAQNLQVEVARHFPASHDAVDPRIPCETYTEAAGRHDQDSVRACGVRKLGICMRQEWLDSWMVLDEDGQR